MEDTIETLPILQNDVTDQPEITPVTLQVEMDQYSSYIEEVSDQIGAFRINTITGWINESKRLPLPKMLFDSFWFEEEICILFASSNQGKSLLAIQIADSISRGTPIAGFRFDSVAQQVVYIDFEMSAKQFEARYCKDGQNHFLWADNFRRCEINPDAEIPSSCKNQEDYLALSIEQVIKRTGTKVLIIDNLTYLASDTETAKSAAPLMKMLKQLKAKYNLSMLILAHTPKRDSTRPITQNDLQGSSRLMQFCDSSFAIGASVQGSDTKYLKQIKARNTAIEYDTDNVIVCHVQHNENFLHFELSGHSNEREHLKAILNEDQAQKNAKIRELHAAGKTQRDIAAEVGTSLSSVNRVLKAHKYTS